MTDPWRGHDGPLLYAHRGACVEWPENSLPAFEAALSCGADVIESDVHMTRDGHVVLSHDASGARTAGIAREIRACTLQECKRWDLCFGFAGRALATTVALPTLDEALAALPDALFNLDVKQREPDMTAPLVRAIERHDACARVLLTSFDARVLARVRARYPGPVGLCRQDALRALFAPGALLRRAPLPGQRLQIPPRYGPLRLDSTRFVRKMHGLGVCVDYWVINQPTQADALLARGADGIVTDDPRSMASVFARSPHTAAWRARHRLAGPAR